MHGAAKLPHVPITNVMQYWREINAKIMFTDNTYEY
jgi:hypothetical protein